MNYKTFEISPKIEKDLKILTSLTTAGEIEVQLYGDFHDTWTQAKEYETSDLILSNRRLDPFVIPTVQMTRYRDHILYK